MVVSCDIAPSRRQLALGPWDRHRDYPPAGPCTRLTSRNPPLRSRKDTCGPVEPRPPRATAGPPTWPAT